MVSDKVLALIDFYEKNGHPPKSGPVYNWLRYRRRGGAISVDDEEALQKAGLLFLLEPPSKRLQRAYVKVLTEDPSSYDMLTSKNRFGRWFKRNASRLEAEGVDLPIRNLGAKPLSQDIARKYKAESLLRSLQQESPLSKKQYYLLYNIRKKYKQGITLTVPEEGVIEWLKERKRI